MCVGKSDTDNPAYYPPDKPEDMWYKSQDKTGNYAKDKQYSYTAICILQFSGDFSCHIYQSLCAFVFKCYHKVRKGAFLLGCGKASDEIIV